MIQNIRHRGLKRLYEKGDRRGLDTHLVEKIAHILTVLDAATSPQALDLPGFRLHPLAGNLKGWWSVSVRANWRIIFRMEEGHAQDVDLVDYH